MAHLNKAAHQLFASQHGVASVDQLVHAGHSLGGIKRLQSSGAIVKALRGAYRSPSTPITELSRCAAVCLARPGVAISGPTAGRLWGFRRMPRDNRIHILSSPASQPAVARWVIPYRTSARHDGDIAERPDGIRLTTPARTAFDLARHLNNTDLLSVIEQAMNDHGLSESDMRRVAIDWLSPQRAWARNYLHVLNTRLDGPAAESHPEVRFADALRKGGVRGLTRQFEISLPGFGAARFDLAIPHLKWAIEVDVHPTHEESAGRQSDARRDRAAEQLGWTTRRITREGYLERFDEEVRATITHYHHLVHQRAMSKRAG